MTAKTFYTILFFWLAAAGFSQTPNWQWARNSGGNQAGQAYDVASDRFGNAYVVGTYSGFAYFDTFHLVGTGDRDMFIAKYDTAGHVIWAKSAGGSAYNDIWSIAYDPSGYFYITGGCGNLATFGNIVTNSFGNLFVAKYDLNGNAIWARRGGGNGTSSDYGRKIHVDEHGYVYVAGRFGGTATFGSISLSASTLNEDIVLLKYDSAGNVLWAKQGTGPGTDIGLGITTDKFGNVYATGTYTLNLSMGGKSISGGGQLYVDDIFIAKLNSTGAVQWLEKIATDNYDYGIGVTTDSIGNVYFCGTVADTTMFDTIQANYTHGNAIYLAKYNPSGSALWVRIANNYGNANEYGFELETDRTGNIVMTGVFSDTLTIGPYRLKTHGSGDMFVTQYDLEGNCRWAKGAGGIGHEIGYGIGIAPSGAIYAAGNVYSDTAYFDTTTTGSSGAEKIIAVARLKGCSLPFKPVITAASGSLLCNGDSALLLVTPSAYNYIWNNRAKGNSLLVKSSGTYTVAAVDINGCVSEDSDPVSVAINTHAPIAIQYSPTGNLCEGDTVTLSTTSAAQYQWTGGASTSTLKVTASGTYAVSVTFADGCSASATPVSFTFHPRPSKAITTSGPLNFCSGGSVTLSVPTGNTYHWSNNQTSASITTSQAGIYFLTITDSYGCSASSVKDTVVVYSLPSATVTNTGSLTFCDGGSTTLSAPSGYTYNWSNGNTGSSIVVSQSGLYKVTVSDTHSCSALSSAVTVTVRANPVPVINNSGPLSFCKGQNVTLTASGGSSYLWSTGTPGNILQLTNSGTFQVTVTNSFGCQAVSAPVTIVTYALPNAAISASGTTTFCAGNAVGLIAASGYSYLWSNGNTTDAIQVTQTGNYTVTVTDNHSCTASSNPISVLVHPLPSAAISPSQQVNICSSDTLSITASGGNSYVWNTNETAAQIQVLQNGIYYATVTDINGCAAVSDTAFVTILPMPSASLTLDTDSIPSDAAMLNLTGGLPVGGTYFIDGIEATVLTPGSLNTGLHRIAYLVVSPFGCADTAFKNIVIYTPAEKCDQYSGKINLDYLQTYPNPIPVTTHELTITNDYCELVPLKADIIDVSGKVVVHLESILPMQTIDLTSLAAGVYTLWFKIEKQRKPVRLVKL